MVARLGRPVAPVGNRSRNQPAVPAAPLMLLLQDEEARAQISHATAPSNSAHIKANISKWTVQAVM